MAKNVKIILVMLFCVVFILSCSTACFPEVGELTGQENASQTENTDGNADTGNTNNTENLVIQELNELKDRIVSPPMILSFEAGEVIYGSGDKELIFLKGCADKGNTIEVYVNGVQHNDLIVDNNGNFETLNGIEIIEGRNDIELISVDSSGRKSDTTEFSLFLDVPQKVEYALYNNGTDLDEIGDTYYTEEIHPLAYIKGSHIPSSIVSIQVNDKIMGEVEADSGGLFELEDIILDQGSNEIVIWGVSPDGSISAPVFKEVVVCRDLDVPYPSNLTGYQQDEANYLTWDTSPDTYFDSYKLVRVEDPCLNPDYPEHDVIATFSDINTTNYIDNDIVSGKSYFYTLWSLDEAGHAISSNVVGIPKPDYTISISPITTSADNTISRREWYYQPFEITNEGTVPLNIQPLMAWIELNPNTEGEDVEISPLWEVKMWNPDASEYYYESGGIFETYYADWVKTDGYTTTEETTVYSADGLTKTVTTIETTQVTEYSEVNSKRLMSTTVVTTTEVTDLTTGITTTTTLTPDTNTTLVEPEKIGSIIEGLKPGESTIVEVKIQNIAAENGEKIIVHFHFVPVDCDGYYYIDEIVSTGGVIAIGRSRD
ncbi:MAG: hypothetical protein U9O59_08780 [Actinomycetota bacterium]|nr:hypothetical protein [Actinomycetota bacterium]